ncbi:MAG TPA: HDOD domain-containing protein [Burkholderiales bacterium]|nr:HDOD domain-containing protein [Burkholderiales bacterium]
MKPLQAADQGGVIDLPVNVRVLTRLLSAFDDSSSMRALSELTLCDPALALHVMASAGPVAADDPAQALSMDARVSLLGLDMLHALVYRQIGKHFQSAAAQHPQSALTSIWARSILCAELASGLARRFKKPTAPARLAGLFHLLGQLALLRSRPEIYATVLASAPNVNDLLRAEREAFSTTHDAAGAALLETSGLPGFSPEAVRLQHEPLERLIDAPFEVRAVRIASALAARGLTTETTNAAATLLGIEAPALTQLMQESLAAARANPAGIDIQEKAATTSVAPPKDAPAILGGDLSLQLPARFDVPANQNLVETVSAFAESGAQWTMRQALASATDQNGALLRGRRLTRLLTGLGPQVFFVISTDGKHLVPALLEGDSRDLDELTVTIERSPSLLARAARDRLPARVTGSALAEGAAIDRSLARMLGTDDLLCLPMIHDSNLAGVTLVALCTEHEEIAESRALLARIAALTAETILRAGRRARSDEQLRIELTERFRAAGKRVVHEAGNPLSIVKNYLKLLGDKLADTAQVREEVTILNEELDRVTRIVQRMGDPFAIDIDEPARLDLNSVVHELMTLCRDTLFAKRGIEVMQQLDPQLPLLRADAGAVKQVALNVMTNAAEAMPTGGRLNVMTADNVNLGGELFILLQISDTGGGVTPELMQRLFKPGPTTKGEGHEGIGLAVSASILQRLGGHILCRSSIGRGTIFLILLPRRLYAAEPAGSEPHAPEAAAHKDS